MLPATQAQTIIADKAYDAQDRVIEPLRKAGGRVRPLARRRNEARAEQIKQAFLLMKANGRASRMKGFLAQLDPTTVSCLDRRE